MGFHQIWQEFLPLALKGLDHNPEIICPLTTPTSVLDCGYGLPDACWASDVSERLEECYVSLQLRCSEPVGSSDCRM